MSQELMNIKELQALIASLGTEDGPDQPLGKYGRMAMRHLRETDPQRFTVLKMTGELTGWTGKRPTGLRQYHSDCWRKTRCPRPTTYWFGRAI